MEDWYIITIISMAVYIVQGLLLKLAAMRGVEGNLTTFFHLVTVAVITVPLILIFGVSQVTLLGIFAALVNGVSYAIGSTNRLSALKHLPASIVYPIIKLNTTVLVIIFVIFFGETLTVQNVLGVILSFISLYLIKNGEAS